MQLLESGEMYLETILILSKKMDKVRSIDIAAEMGFSKPSVSRAMGKLKADAYIRIEEGGSVVLTVTGREIAEKIYERHLLLTQMLVSLGIDEETASEDACRIEHVISDKTMEALKKHIRG